MERRDLEKLNENNENQKAWKTKGLHFTGNRRVAWRRYILVSTWRGCLKRISHRPATQTSYVWNKVDFFRNWQHFAILEANSSPNFVNFLNNHLLPLAHTPKQNTDIRGTLLLRAANTKIRINVQTITSDWKVV